MDEYRRDTGIQPGEVKLIQCFLERESGCFYPSPVLILLPGICFCHEQIQKKVAKIRISPTLPKNISVVGKCRQLQLLAQELNRKRKTSLRAYRKSQVGFTLTCLLPAVFPQWNCRKVDTR